jgi:hypothetical protein
MIGHLAKRRKMTEEASVCFAIRDEAGGQAHNKTFL